MLICDVGKGTKISLTVTMGRNKLIFETQAIEGVRTSRCGLKVMPVYVEEKLLGFHGYGVLSQASVVNETDNMPYIWNDVKIISIKDKEGDIYQIIQSNDDVNPCNRRDNYRVWLGVDAVAQVGLNKSSFDVLVKDISISGISFIIRDEKEIAIGSIVNLSFYDKETETNFRVGAIVVRQQALEEMKNLYGCRLNMDSPLVRRFVAQKQRLRAKENSM